jgi:hypothetical protein
MILIGMFVCFFLVVAQPFEDQGKHTAPVQTRARRAVPLRLAGQALPLQVQTMERIE